MLQINVIGKEEWDEKTEQFIYPKGTVIHLEHSLISISKWESKWHKSYFARQEKSQEEIVDYIKCMTVDRNVDPLVYNCLTQEDLKTIADYIDDSQSAIPVNKGKGGGHEFIVSEKIYFWMFSYRIPKECEKWHISRLLNLIDYFNDANTPAKKRKPSEIQKSYAAINAQRKAALHTKG